VIAVTRLKRRLRKAGRRYREARMLVNAFRYPYQPVVAHLIPIRRCNLSCAYCNEYDDRSNPIETVELFRRIDQLSRLRTGIVTFSGGEPLLHPDLDRIVARARANGMIATLITNGYLLTRERVLRLNRAGLDHLQISVDNVVPDDVSVKSLKVLDQKLRTLADAAEFDVTINAVVGGAIRNPDDAVVIARRAHALGFATTIGIIHDGEGQLLPLDERQRTVLETVVAIGKSAFDFANYNRFQKNLANGRPNDWQCRAGSRYLYVCEDGLVHWCSQQRGRPGIPLEQYGVAELEREQRGRKSCAPFCTVGCVHRVAQLDELRERPEATLAQWFPPATPGRALTAPRPVRFLTWAFVSGPGGRVLRRAAVRLLADPRRVS
jgi:MoaA/NifB/PqqE/SkfB family radical SAM enzyme